jgi:integrase/recombinase XerD
MRENRNNINELDQRSRVLKALGIIAPALAPEPEPMQLEGGFDEEDPPPDDVPAEPPPGDMAPTETAAIVVAPQVAAVVGAADDVLARFLDSCAAMKTRITMRQGLDRAARMMGAGRAEEIPWPNLRFEHTDALRAALLRAVHEKRYGMATVRITLQSVKGVLMQAVRMKAMLPQDFAYATMWRRLPKHDRLPIGREIPEEEINRLWAYCDEVGSAYGAWLKATIALLLGTGLRATEACEMPIEGYDPVTRHVRLIRKGGKENNQPLGEPETAALNAWLPIRMGFQKRLSTRALLVRVHTNDWVRPSSPLCTVKILENVFVDVAKKAGVQRFAPHDLRRTFCTRGYDQGADTSIMQRLMGHASPETTVRYDKRGERSIAAARAKLNIIPGPKVDGSEPPLV